MKPILLVKKTLISISLLFILNTVLNAQIPVSYTFTGNGNWSTATNWLNNSIPASIVPGRDTITIAPSNGDSCVLHQPLVVLPGAIFTVQTGANLILTGNAPLPTIYPANILDLSNWKINLPIDDTGGQAGPSEEIDQPKLATFAIYPFSEMIQLIPGVIFNADCGGATTSGSGYPRSELRGNDKQWNGIGKLVFFGRYKCHGDRSGCYTFACGKKSNCSWANSWFQ